MKDYSSFKANDSVYKPQAITILATYKCTAMCQHCCFDCGPSITERLSISEMYDFIDQAAEYSSLKLVGFSGGECFLLGKDLDDAVNYAHKKGLRTRCVTNGYWAKSILSGRKRLERLIDAGLNELNISTGDFHQKYVPIDSVINAALLGVELGLEHTLIVVELQKNRMITANNIYSNPRIMELARKNQDSFNIIESPWMPLDHNDSISQTDDRFLNRETLHSKRGCRSVLNTLVLSPSKKIGFCCGLSRELIAELNTNLDAPLSQILGEHSNDFIKIWLFVDGPEKILAWAASKDSNIHWENRYAHQCHACLAIFQDQKVRDVIRLFYRERIEDVLIRYNLIVRKQHIIDAIMLN